ncbi:hypothetical protein ACHQM5_000197 [Ranunculus cassubicifolius]
MAAADIPLNENQTDIPAILAQSLPKHVIIQSSQKDNRYLHLSKENPNVPNALRFVGDYSFELDTRFEVEEAKTATGLIHIRSLMNNKYWANYGTANNWLAAMADKPEENQSDKQCTLFQPIFMSSNNNRDFTLRHVQTGLFATYFHGSSEHSLALLALMPGPDHQGADVCTFIDWESVVMLPDRIRITSSNYGNQLKAFADGFMDFNSKANNSTLFDYDVYPSRDGGIRLKSTYYGNYWTDMENSDWVLLQKADTDVHNTNTVFLPTIRGDNRVIIRCLKNNLFCKRFTTRTQTSCLATRLPYPDESSDMEIEVPVLSRRINNVRYHLTNARLYNEKSIALITDDSSNRTMHSLTSTLNLKTTVSNTTNWSTSVSLKLGIKSTVSFGIPLIASGQIEISAEVTGSMDWGETKTESQEVGSEKTIVVPSMTRVKAGLMGTRVSYDVPFSYTQYDVLTDGSTKKYEKNDGFFTAHNGYGYRYDVVELPIE